MSLKAHTIKLDYDGVLMGAKAHSHACQILIYVKTSFSLITYHAKKFGCANKSGKTSIGSIQTILKHPSASV